MEITGLPTPVFCGVDWAEDHHDVALVDASGTQLAKLRISDDADGFAQLTTLLVEHGDHADAPIPVAIETSRGLLVACLRASGRSVYAINPLAVARYRDRHSVARKKSDAVDAAVLANILRTDMAAHRPLPTDSELVQAIAVLARAQQDAVWDRGQAHNRLRSQLREFYPAILDAFAQHKHGLSSREARTILAAAPTPAKAARLTHRRLQTLLKQAGRVRGIEAEADRIHEVFQRDYLHQLPQVEAALGRQTTALLRQLNTACQNADDLEEATAQAFEEHPDAE
ncbi:IS110 family transposase, partial [Streptomyces sp. NPDC019208]